MTDYVLGKQEPDDPCKDYEDGSLEHRLCVLQQYTGNEPKAQIDAKIAVLKRLIVDADKAQETYRVEHKRLEYRQSELREQEKKINNALCANLSWDDINKINNTVKQKLERIPALEEVVQKAKDAVHRAQANADAAEEALANSQAILEIWRRPTASTDNRQKAAETLIQEINKLRIEGKLAEALGRLSYKPLAGVPSGIFLNEILGQQPVIVEPGKPLQDKIIGAFHKFDCDQRASIAANDELAKKRAALKEAEEKLEGARKNLVKDIQEALADLEIMPSTAKAPQTLT